MPAVSSCVGATGIPLGDDRPWVPPVHIPYIKSYTPLGVHNGGRKGLLITVYMTGALAGGVEYAEGGAPMANMATL